MLSHNVGIYAKPNPEGDKNTQAYLGKVHELFIKEIERKRGSKLQGVKNSIIQILKSLSKMNIFDFL